MYRNMLRVEANDQQLFSWRMIAFRRSPTS